MSQWKSNDGAAWTRTFVSGDGVTGTEGQEDQETVVPSLAEIYDKVVGIYPEK